MTITKQEIVHPDGRSQFNLVNEHGLILAVVAGFEKKQNKKHAILFENAPEMLEMLLQIHNEKFEFYNWNKLESLISKATTL